MFFIDGLQKTVKEVKKTIGEDVREEEEEVGGAAVWLDIAGAVKQIEGFKNWEINLQSLEDTQVGYISQKYTLDNYTFFLLAHKQKFTWKFQGVIRTLISQNWFSPRNNSNQSKSFNHTFERGKHL